MCTKVSDGKTRYARRYFRQANKLRSPSKHLNALSPARPWVGGTPRARPPRAGQCTPLRRRNLIHPYVKYSTPVIMPVYNDYTLEQDIGFSMIIINTGNNSRKRFGSYSTYWLHFVKVHMITDERLRIRVPVHECECDKIARFMQIKAPVETSQNVWQDWEWSKPNLSDKQHKPLRAITTRKTVGRPRFVYWQ